MLHSADSFIYQQKNIWFELRRDVFVINYLNYDEQNKFLLFEQVYGDLIDNLKVETKITWWVWFANVVACQILTFKSCIGYHPWNKNHSNYSPGECKWNVKQKIIFRTNFIDCKNDTKQT